VEVKREDRLKNEYVRGIIGIVLIVDNTREKNWIVSFCYERRFGSSKNGYGIERYR